MRKKHLNFLPFVTADFVGFRLPAGSREVSGVLVFFATDRSADRIGAALFFGGASLAVGFQRAVFASAGNILAAIGIGVVAPELFEREAFRADVLIVGFVILKLEPCPCSVFSVRMIDHRNEGDDPTLLDQPTQVIAGAIAEIAQSGGALRRRSTPFPERHLR